MAVWLCFAAAPVFALMALLSAASGNMDMACMAAPHTMPLGGMALMYGLMSAFHSAPWLKRIATRMAVAP